MPDTRATSTKVSFERATAAHHEWLYRLHEQAHRELVERAYGPWEEGQQRDFFRPLRDASA